MSARPDLGRSSDDGSLQLLVGGGGEPEMLLVIECPRSDGRVAVRSWTSDDWSAPPTSGDREAAELLRDVERWSRAGRSLNEPLASVRRWLDRR